MSTYLVTFADENFIKSAIFQKKISRELHFDDHFLFTPADLSAEFCKKNHATLSFPRGYGFWIWKPRIILDTLATLPTSSTLLYLDAGALPTKAADAFELLASDNRVHIWSENDDFRNYQWIDGDVAKSLKLNNSHLSQTHYMAGLICSRNTLEFRRILQTWLDYCENPRQLRPETFPRYSPRGKLIWHRHDQALLNSLVCKSKESFTTHSASDLFSAKELFIIHRRGYISSKLDLFLFLFFRGSKRIFAGILPSRIHHGLNMRITRVRKPYISPSESRRNRKLR